MSYADPVEYPPAQCPRVARRAQPPNRRRHGWVRTHPNASAWDVLHDVQDHSELPEPPFVQPYNAVQWYQVESVILPRASDAPPLRGSVDIRRTIWEMVQVPRQIPIFRSGECVLLVATSTIHPPEQALWRAQEHLDMEDYEELMMHVTVQGVWTASIERIRRAGARSSAAAEREMSQNTQPIQTMPVGAKRMLEVTLPPTPARQVSIISQGGRTYGDMQKLVAKRFMVPEAKVRIITVAEDDQNNLETVCGEPVSRPPEGVPFNQGSLLTALPQDQQRSPVKCAWRWATQSVMSKSTQVELPADSRVADMVWLAIEGMETDPLDVAVEYLGMIVGFHCPLGQFSNGTLILHLREVGIDQSPWSSPTLFRAGAKGRERGKAVQIPTSYQKQEMQKWAVQKINEHMPHLPHKVAKHLAKAENRTVSAVMNSKSPVQTAHVVIAALRRAGIDDLANTLSRGLQDGAATVTDHGRQDDADMGQTDLNGAEPQQPQPTSVDQVPELAENQQELTQVQRDMAAVAQMVLHQHTATQSLAYALQQHTQTMNIAPWMGSMGRIATSVY